MERQIDDIAWWEAVKIGLFDAAFYRESYPDIPSTINVYDHYRRCGWKELRNPSRLFVSDIHSENPLVAFVKDIKSGLPGPNGVSLIELKRAAFSQKLFDPGYYRTFYPEIVGSDDELFVHYLATGWKEGRNPSALFNTSGYIQKSAPDSNAPLFHHIITANDNQIGKSLPGTLYSHFVESLVWRLLRAGMFDAAWYADEYPDIVASGMSPIAHYTRYGFWENRIPHPALDLEYYNFYHNTNFEIHEAIIHYLLCNDTIQLAPSAEVKELREENQALSAQAGVIAQTLDKKYLNMLKSYAKLKKSSLRSA